jgi:O-acetyl-ADP-ribose deacetylase (regulator of RNase III)
MYIISDVEAIQSILAIRGRFAVYAGAGVSAEARVTTAWGICEEIRDWLRQIHLPNSATPEEVGFWENSFLSWNDLANRYAVCIKQRYSTPAARVAYFRSKLEGKRPSFSHHAIALLMARGHLKATCITTNFDKLLESAFVQQGLKECQAIRNDAEIEYWRNDPDRCYALKLHGDYDTYNILNTVEETIRISKPLGVVVSGLLQDSGLVVLGTAGQETSISSMFDELSLAVMEARGKAGSILSYGLLWGVYMGAQKPEGLNAGQIEGLVRQRIEGGEVGRGIAAMVNRLAHVGLVRFFPVWGAGNFLFDLVNATPDKWLRGTAELYLDHEMRLRYLFARKGLPQNAITGHIASLNQQQKKLDLKPQQRSPFPETALVASTQDCGAEVRILYGDVTKRSFMDGEEFRSLRRAIVSPEDTCLSSGGGVAYRLLEKAGSFFVLNELAKFAPIEQGAVAITSGGNLPVHYIFHAASIEIENTGNYAVSEDDVRITMEAILEKAATLKVGVLWVPLLGSGVATLGPRQSLDGILRAVASWTGRLILLIFIYRENVLSRQEARECLLTNLNSGYTIASP